MLCARCKQRSATVVISEVKNKEKVCEHLCEECAQKNSQFIEQPSFSYSVNTLLSQFLEMIASKLQEEEEKLQCSECGITYNEFRKVGRFGCKNDYDVFQKMLVKLLAHIHESSKHRGKVPKDFAAKESLTKQLADLQQQLQQAVVEEKYEQAAEIRDDINRLKENMHEPR